MTNKHGRLLAIVFGLVMILGALVSSHAEASEADDNPPIPDAVIEVPRFLIIANQRHFARSDTLPFRWLEPMCWTPETGFCDAILHDDSARLSRIAIVIDYDTGHHAELFAINRRCFIWWYFPFYGEDGNPHVRMPYWIDCNWSVLP